MPPLEKFAALSLFDRLIDEDPARLDDPPTSASDRLRKMREQIRRDLEDLLNAHRMPRGVETIYPELEQSLLCLGTTGFHGLMLVTRAQRQRLASAIQKLIETFEPRLVNARVSLGRESEEKARSLGLRIEAEYRSPEGVERLTFETALDPTHRHFSIIGKRNG